MQVHGNVCLASVVVTETLDWKLHGLDVLSEFDGANPAASGPMLVSSSHLFPAHDTVRPYDFVKSILIIQLVSFVCICSNMNGSWVHNLNPWSWQKVIGLPFGNLLRGHLTPGAWVSLALRCFISLSLVDLCKYVDSISCKVIFNYHWALLITGCLIYDLFSSTKLAKTEDLRNTSQIPKVMTMTFRLQLHCAGCIDAVNGCSRYSPHSFAGVTICRPCFQTIRSFWHLLL